MISVGGLSKLRSFFFPVVAEIAIESGTFYEAPSIYEGGPVYESGPAVYEGGAPLYEGGPPAQEPGWTISSVLFVLFFPFCFFFFSPTSFSCLDKYFSHRPIFQRIHGRWPCWGFTQN